MTHFEDDLDFSEFGKLRADTKNPVSDIDIYINSAWHVRNKNE
jgi:hypothetical protein